MNPFAIDQTFVVSVKALREILTEITTDKERWWIEDEKEKGVVIGYNGTGDEVNNVLFEFPKIAQIPFPDGDGEIICLYPVSREAVQRGLYWQDDRLLADEVRDWESFWQPLVKRIAERYAEGSGVRSMSSTENDSSSSSPNRNTT